MVNYLSDFFLKIQSKYGTEYMTLSILILTIEWKSDLDLDFKVICLYFLQKSLGAKCL